MPIVRNRSSVQRWTTSATGVTDSSIYSIRAARSQRGFDSQAFEPRNQVLPYWGYTAVGRVTRMASPAIRTYAPIPTDANMPYTLSLGGTQPLPPEIITARNKSWDKLMEKVKGTDSSLGTTLAEGREGLELIGTRVGKLFKAGRALASGNPKKFFRELSVDPKRKHKSLTRTTALETSGLWLEYWFGWAPLCSDIFDTAVTLSVDPAVGVPIREKAGAKFRLPKLSALVGTSDRRYVSREGRGVYYQGAYFKVWNENLFLANRLGLINPASVAWELVPFSFVVDWFVGVNSFMNGFTDLAGVTPYHAFSGWYCESTARGVYYRNWSYPPPNFPPNRCEAVWSEVRQQRYDSLSTPLPQWPTRRLFGSSLTRGATAASLLSQLFLQWSDDPVRLNINLNKKGFYL